MIIRKTKPKFEPIVLSLKIETPEELQVLKCLASDGHYIGGVLGNRNCIDKKTAYNIFDQLCDELSP